MKRIAFTSIAVSMIAVAGAAQATTVNRAVTEAEVLAAQQAWCDALVSISETYGKDGHAAARAFAEQVIDSAYAYQMGVVLFKPTLTVVPQTFRTTRDGALSYFVGGDSNYPNDSGFALKGWTACSATNAGIFISGNSATSMGNVSITDKSGAVTTVDKTWKFVKDDEGQLRIAVHHSSLPYSGN